tara:strand:+ start:313 stop:459 length:147 start_codon:yes stop_codon:yes gene_type:complete
LDKLLNPPSGRFPADPSSAADTGVPVDFAASAAAAVLIPYILFSPFIF